MDASSNKECSNWSNSCSNVLPSNVFIYCQAQPSLNPAKAELCSIFIFSSHPTTLPVNYQESKIKLLYKTKSICLHELSTKLFLDLASNPWHQERAKIHMTGTMTNPMSVDLRLWMEGRLSICPYLTVVRFITLPLLYILSFSTFSLIKTFDFMILMLYLVPV